jgi:ABC-type enterochelin transport system permease subunit
MNGAIPPLSQYAFMAWCLVKNRDNLTFIIVVVVVVVVFPCADTMYNHVNTPNEFLPVAANLF